MNPETKDARELIAFYLDSGADAFLGEEPVDRMADERPLPTAPASLQPPSPSLPSKATGGGMGPVQARTFFQTAAPASPEAAAMAARQAASSAATLDDLHALLTKFEGCALRTTATQVVFADG